MARRVGTFFFILGGFLILLFIYTDSLQSAYFRYLIFGVLSLLMGFALFVFSAKPGPPPESSRFRLLKREREKKANSKHG